ncbi:hypothetical protein L1987_05651 [Smallanthus sonchifolius]|uniref:Uncharacterized protein n=1 Tax=Smallanthus sonchifolius TaxID=185202 RepID=A0ACB9JW23_9ASTR|nr:hypothetical protein L1987_05651 [Smallanthus sonchifolius]
MHGHGDSLHGTAVKVPGQEQPGNGPVIWVQNFPDGPNAHDHFVDPLLNRKAFNREFANCIKPVQDNVMGSTEGVQDHVPVDKKVKIRKDQQHIKMAIQTHRQTQPNPISQIKPPLQKIRKNQQHIKHNSIKPNIPAKISVSNNKVKSQKHQESIEREAFENPNCRYQRLN